MEENEMKKIIVALFGLMICATLSNVDAGTFTWDHKVIPLDNVVNVTTKAKTTDTKKLGNNITNTGSHGVKVWLYKGNTCLTGTGTWYKGDNFTVSYLAGKTAKKGDKVTVKLKNGSYAALPYDVKGTCNYY